MSSRRDVVSVSLVVDPELGFAQLDARLAALGFARDPSVRPVTPDARPGEPELAAWSRDGERLTYTFNPVVSLRSLTAETLSATTAGVLQSRLPLLDVPGVGTLLTSAEPRRILLGIFAARALDAGDLALIVASLQAHADASISRAAAAALPVLQASPRATPRQQTLTTMQILCRRAIPALSALVGPDGARALDAGDLALIVASLQAHTDSSISRAASAALPVLQASPRATPRQQTLTTMQILCRRAVPALSALVGPDGARAIETMRPRAEDYARVFDAALADRVREAYEEVWRTPPVVEQLVSGEITLRVDAVPAGMLHGENELSRRFPGGYRALAPYLVPDRIWFVWRYLRPGADAGMRYDGAVLLDDRWVWFPKPYAVVGEIVEGRSRR